jgi:lambda repressor-like predicted transcriptional regulator
MHPEDIRAELRKKGSNQSKLGRSLKPPVTRSTVAKVINGQTKSRRIAEAVARIIEKTIDEVFPGQYPPANDNTWPDAPNS